MPGEILRRPQARLDLIDIWNYIADDNEAAADRMLDRIESVLWMLSEQPKAGRERPELAPGLRSLPGWKLPVVTAVRLSLCVLQNKCLLSIVCGVFCLVSI